MWDFFLWQCEITTWRFLLYFTTRRTQRSRLSAIGILRSCYDFVDQRSKGSLTWRNLKGRFVCKLYGKENPCNIKARQVGGSRGKSSVVRSRQFMQYLKLFILGHVICKRPIKANVWKWKFQQRPKQDTKVQYIKLSILVRVIVSSKRLRLDTSWSEYFLEYEMQAGPSSIGINGTNFQDNQEVNP